MDWCFLCYFTKFKFWFRSLCKIRTAWFDSLYEHPLASQVFFSPLSLSTVLACRSCVCLCVCVCTSLYTEAQNQFLIANMHVENLHIVSIKQLYENKGACSFLVIQSSYCLLDRSRPKRTITVFCSDLEVAAAFHSILPCTESIKGESKICNKSK